MRLVIPLRNALGIALLAALIWLGIFQAAHAQTINTTAASARPQITANRIYYVRKDGNDSSTCLNDAAGGACLTVMGALNQAKRIDFNGYTVTVQIRAGTYNERILVPAMVGQGIPENLILLGDLATPTNVVLKNLSNFQPTIEANVGSKIVLGGGVSIGASATGGYDINAAEGGVISVSGNVDFAAAGEYHAYANNGGTINFFSPYTISGAAKAHWAAALSGQIYSKTTIDAQSLAMNFSFAFAASFAGGNMQISGNTFNNVGSITGARYATQKNGVIETFGAGASYLPGNAVGTSVTGGQYG